jgi:hypothetical protein
MPPPGKGSPPDSRFTSEVPVQELIFRDFAGVNVASPRESIKDEQFRWLENVIPLAHGNLAVVNAPSGVLSTFAGQTIHSLSVAILGVDYIFAFLADGSAYYCTLSALTPVSFASAGTFTAPTAIPYTSTAGVSGILIVDPVNGYWDWGVTTALTLTQISQTALAVNVTQQGGKFTAAPTIGFSSGTATATAYIGARQVTLTAAGTLYQIGDVLTIAGGTGLSLATLTVLTTTPATGAILTFSITTQGAYTTIPGSPVTVTGGVGSGCTVTPVWGVTEIHVTAPGSGYSTAPTITNLNSSGGVGAAATVVVGAALNGTAIASYAGRVWIAIGKVIAFTDVGTWNSFAGAGGQLTINDSYLHDNITALYAANGFLYIFGSDSIDILSNVTVVNGVTAFSRTNITSSVGTSSPRSIYPFSRSLMFANNYGVYALSGATPQKVSTNLDGLFDPNVFVGGLIAGSVTIFGELCIAWTMRIVDRFTTIYGVNTTRTVLAVLFRDMWFFVYPTTTGVGFDIGDMLSMPIGDLQALYTFPLAGSNTMRKMFDVQNAITMAYLQTKLWDGGSPVSTKELIRVGLGSSLGAAVSRTVVVTTDNEYTSQSVALVSTELGSGVLTFINFASAPLSFVQSSGVPLVFTSLPSSGYSFKAGKANQMAGKFFGLSITMHQTNINVTLAAVAYRVTRAW